MDVTSGAEGQFTNKLLVEISGTIKGFIKNVDIEMVEGKILIHMKLGQSAESYGLSRSESKLLRFETKVTVAADEIVSVGKDCVVVSKGKIPPLDEIKKAKMFKAENDSLKEKLNEVNDELENSLRKLKVLKEDKAELEFKLNKLLKLEDGYNELRLKCAKQEGELEVSRRFMEKLKNQGIIKENMFSGNESDIDDTMQDEIKKKFEDIINDEFSLVEEEEKGLSEEGGSGSTTQASKAYSEPQKPGVTTQGKDNPFKKFTKEYKK